MSHRTSIGVTWLTLFASTGTLICCALPILLVALGFGATVAALTDAAPALITLSRQKGWIFAMSGAMLLLSAWLLYKREQQCPGEPVKAALCRRVRRGRHRHFSIASAEVADALEALSILGSHRAVRPGLCSLQREPLREARGCYDHLAGRLGVVLVESLVNKCCLEEGDDAYVITDEGRRFLSKLGVDIEAARRRRRAFARKCMDWSEARHHLGGALGAALTARLYDLDWLRQAPKSRVITITPYGGRHLRELGLISD